MFRWLNVFAVAALLGSALYAYSIKYETARYSAEILKTQHAIQRERDAVSLLRADYAWLARPGRLQQLSERHLELQNLNIDQIVKPSELPERIAKGDVIARKLEALGLADLAPSTPVSGAAASPASARGGR